MNQISLESLNAADRGSFIAALGEVMEHAPWVAEVVYAARPFASLAALYRAMIDAVLKGGDARKLALINGHPELAVKALDSLTADSAAEQGGAGLDRLTPEELAAFQRLNEAYRSKFGIPFIICVRRHGRDSILRNFRQRLENDAATERDAALAEIFRIAALRLDLRVTAPDRLKVHGSLSTHVLDTSGGCPATDIAIELCEIPASGAARILARMTTNADGRTDQPLIAGRPVPIGSYELRFAVGDYFKRRGGVVSDPPFLGVVPVRFGVSEPEGHYHVPLLITPWSYATYRGS
ncbi:MAG TPA: 2-oxo-4-hydroxy-4-carboxy-5-ureidoimidazoline decarboxylase [Xanthobacteraceae bacterium]|nr:2-oxo-4-hydroxy-4-carboxy-5-ureidoimidazoline decarboxylase [Xanthobacteraceae bacterium]